MIKTTFRATISDTDLDWIQDYKEEHDLKNNAEVIHHLMKLAEENEKNSKWTKDLSAFLDLNFGFPQPGCALSKKFCQALPKSWIAKLKT
ncbi:hypothetical protein FOC51_11925 (plasmid) [Lactobacillus crispatus]|uniref:hypothetical protein n=1 Tax=Lactobacillus crispatus TaxID=47770 RepID=UPI0012DD6C76|nr:hypothetical protein [Lactobacillus crispatus]QGS06757.1 hypothetical protein FOC51_11925 [Lactobacillus crispatus]